jgi:hypothetical protein
MYVRTGGMMVYNAWFKSYGSSYSFRIDILNQDCFLKMYCTLPQEISRLLLCSQNLNLLSYLSYFLSFLFFLSFFISLFIYFILFILFPFSYYPYIFVLSFLLSSLAFFPSFFIQVTELKHLKRFETFQYIDFKVTKN